MTPTLSHDAWAACVRTALTPQVRTVVGHSFGGSTVLRMATEADLGVDHLVLLAAPDWGPKGWDGGSCTTAAVTS
ncbi:alpha/beta fold hydrolase [Janibacter melonis]|nr:alpha/beta fold hydrolase [Janibacter melonis]